MSSGNIFRRAARAAVRRTLKFKPLGHPLSAALAGVGLVGFSRWASRTSGWSPGRVSFDIPNFNGGGGLHASMSSMDGRDHIVRAIWSHGLERYESPLPRVYLRAIRGATVIVDVGANSGLYAVLGAVAERAAHVYSFEPLPEALASLRENVAINELSSRVTVVPAAAGSENGTAELYVPVKRFGNTIETSASLNRGFRKEHSAKIKVDVATIDSFLENVSAPRVDVIRIDVEAGEHFVLGGAGKTLDECRPLVFVEVLSDSSARLLAPFRARHGYTAISLERSRLVVLPEVVRTPCSDNELWWPQERISDVHQFADDVGLPLIGLGPPAVAATVASVM